MTIEHSIEVYTGNGGIMANEVNLWTNDFRFSI
jgi:hypothetical protein